MMIFKRKQIVVLSLVIMIIIAGYLQYTYNASSTASSKNDSSRLGEAIYVDSNGNKVQSSASKKTKTTSSNSENYFIQTRLNREVSREKGIDSMEQITQDVNASAEVKANAYNKIMQLKNNLEKETRIESLIQEMGYKDVVVIFADDSSVDVYVKADSIQQAQSTQIAEMVSRQANLDMGNIFIKNIS